MSSSELNPVVPDMTEHQRRLALSIVYLGVLTVSVNTTVVTVALPSISADLELSSTSLTWLVNTYMLTFSGFLVLSGRLGDLYGQRSVFLTGVAGFTLASLVCGLASSAATLFVARASQGLGAAIITAVSLSLITTLFEEPTERAKAIAIYGFMNAIGGCIGELLGGLLTQLLGWHWIFLISVPIGLVVTGFGFVTLPASANRECPPLDVGGALTLCAALTLTILALVNYDQPGWSATRMTGALAFAALLFVLFIHLERRARLPLMPLRLFRQREFAIANVLCLLWSAGGFTCFVLTALYLQRGLGFEPFKVGLAFIPTTAMMALSTATIAAKLVVRFGIRGPLSIGLLLMAAGLSWLARGPPQATFTADVLPAMLLVGLGDGIASSPLLLAAMRGIDVSESGLASGIINTVYVMGTMIGLAALASLAAWRTNLLEQAGFEPIAALNAGYHMAFFVGALFVASAAAVAALTFGRQTQLTAHATPCASQSSAPRGVG
jgi:EmrB/QacA subfamily drug resistance transporter